MKTRSLLPVAVLHDPTTASVDRILAHSFWGEPSEVGSAPVTHLDQLRERRAADAASLSRNPVRNR